MIYDLILAIGFDLCFNAAAFGGAPTARHHEIYLILHSYYLILIYGLH